jgi:exosortase/archaeosortase family protein
MGAVLVGERSFPGRQLRPNALGLILGSALLMWVLFRSHLISTWNAGASLLPLLSGISLALMAVPVQGLGPYIPSLFVLALSPLMRALMVLGSAPLFIYINAKITEFFLILAGLPVFQEGDQVLLPGGGVAIGGPCTGIDTILQLLIIAIVFAIAFPMRYRWQNIVMGFCAVAFGLMLNGARLALLALITASSIPSKTWWFDLFHTGFPSLLFPGIGALFFMQMYTQWIEHQVAQHERT